MPRALALGGEEIASQAHRLDHRFRAAGFGELAAQPADARVDRAVEPVVVDAAHDAQDVVARHHAPGLRGEQPQDVEVAGGELEGAAVDRDGAPPAADGGTSGPE